MKYFKYLKYLFRHRWYVMLECFKRKLIWRGLLHDLSKFLPDEFIPYTNYFYGDKKDNIKKGRNETGYYKPTDTGDAAFDFAWLIHQKRNKHHWQWWLLPEDEGGLKIFWMLEPYLTEMICDWIGAGKAQGHFSANNDEYFEVRKWYQQNGNKMKLAKETRIEIESRIK